MDDDEFPPDLVEVDESNVNNSNSTTERIVPITLLTGYLGSGKTTLLNYILEADHGYRIAVCMNDFGDSTDIESTAMSFTPNNDDPTSTSNPETTFLSLPNGCLCCSIKEPGIAAIENMIEEQSQSQSRTLAQSGGGSDEGEGEGGRGKRGEERGIDRVVVELTGVADPAEIARSFWTNEEMGGKLRLDGVVCVVDSRNVIRQLEDGEECQKQIAASDVILLNKVDLVTDDHLDLVERRIRTINPTAMFKRTHRSVIDIGDIFEIGGYSVASTLDAVDVVGRLEGGSTVAKPTTTTRDRIEALGGEAHVHEHGHDHEDDEREEERDSVPEKKHLEGISSLVIDLPVLPSDSLDRLDAFLRSIHWDSILPTREPVASSSSSTSAPTAPPAKTADVPANEDEHEQEDGEQPTQLPTGIEILRTKGIFTLDGPERSTYVLQGVRDIFELNRLNTSLPTTRGESGEAVLDRSKLVVIGKRLGDRESWVEALEVGLRL